MLGSSAVPLTSVYDLAMLDLDGVVYVGGDAVPGAPEHLEAAAGAGIRLAYITNNAARTPGEVAQHLRELGVRADPADVVTSAQAAARVLADRLAPGEPVVLLGGAGLREAVTDVGLTPVGVDDDAVAVVTGYGPDVLWREIMRAAVRIRDGLWWVASNTDLTIPTAYGLAPGHGVLVDTLRRFSGVEPLVAGKPARPLLDETVRRVGGERPLMVGDRLDTDIEGGRAAGIDTLLVLTGVTDLTDLVAAGPESRPTYLAPDLGGLAAAQPDVRLVDGRVAVGGWCAAADSGAVEVTGGGAVADWWRAVAVASWEHLDRTGTPVDTAGLEPPGR